MASAIRLGVNVDHVATLRQARRIREPDPAWAVVLNPNFRACSYRPMNKSGG